MKNIQSRGEKERIINMFWGLSQLYNMPQHGYAAVQAAGQGDWATFASEASKILTSAALAEHTALNYRPRRLMAALPEVGPFLRKSADVKQAELMQEGIERRIERKEKFREAFKEAGTIEDKIKRLRETR
jgi:hypothetical protein